MPAPTTYEPRVNALGTAIMRPIADGSGRYVLKSDYDELERSFFASNRAIADLEQGAAPTTEDADGKTSDS